jgi:hypothetical protein
VARLLFNAKDATETLLENRVTNGIGEHDQSARRLHQAAPFEQPHLVQTAREHVRGLRRRQRLGLLVESGQLAVKLHGRLEKRFGNIRVTANVVLLRATMAPGPDVHVKSNRRPPAC